MIIKTNFAYKSAIKKLAASKPKFFYFATFGLTIDKHLETVLKLLPSDCDVRILIGVTPRTSLKQIIFFKSYFKKYKVKVVRDCHLKLVVTDKGTIVGGMNYTGSGWDDVSMILTHYKAMKQHFEDIFKKKRSI